jgi:hypothetical protein
MPGISVGCGEEVIVFTGVIDAVTVGIDVKVDVRVLSGMNNAAGDGVSTTWIGSGGWFTHPTRNAQSRKANPKNFFMNLPPYNNLILRSLERS